MHFSQSLAIPANTLATAPASIVMPVTQGWVRKVWVRWRWGIGNLGGVRMTYLSFQHWPQSIGQWFPSSPHSLEFGERKLIHTDPFEITIEAYNLCTRFPHTVWVAMEISRITVPVELGDFLASFYE